MPRESAQSVTLLSNAGATGSAAGFGGGKALFTLLPGTGGATTALQILGPDGATYIPISGTSSATAAAVPLDLPAGTYRAAVTGGTAPAAIYASLAGIL